MRFSYFLVTAVIIAAFQTISAQDIPVITIRKSDQATVALAGISGSPEAQRILQNDLSLAGSVAVVDSSRGTFLIRGNASGSGISGEVVDRRGAVVLSKTYPGNLRSAVHAFADDIVSTLTGKPGFASSKIAFVSDKTGRKEIYVADYDGANAVQLTQDRSISVGPSISADRQTLLYTGYKSGYADIYSIDLRNGARGRIIKAPGTNTGAAIAPNGRQIALTMSKDGNPELYVASINGKSARRLTQTRGVEASPSWSPDGNELVYTSDDSGRPQLYRISASGGTPRLIGTGYGYCTEPSWSPDGTKIAFNIRQGGGFAVAIYNLQTGGTQVVTSGSSAEDPCWGADSRHLIYSQNNSIQLLDTQTGQSRTVISGLGRISEPSWSY